MKICQILQIRPPWARRQHHTSCMRSHLRCHVIGGARLGLGHDQAWQTVLTGGCSSSPPSEAGAAFISLIWWSWLVFAGCDRSCPGLLAGVLNGKKSSFLYYRALHVLEVQLQRFTSVQAAIIARLLLRSSSHHERAIWQIAGDSRTRPQATKMSSACASAANDFLGTTVVRKIRDWWKRFRHLRVERKVRFFKVNFSRICWIGRNFRLVFGRSIACILPITSDMVRPVSFSTRIQRTHRNNDIRDSNNDIVVAVKPLSRND